MLEGVLLWTVPIGVAGGLLAYRLSTGREQWDSEDWLFVGGTVGLSVFAVRTQVLASFDTLTAQTVWAVGGSIALIAVVAAALSLPMGRWPSTTSSRLS